MPSPRRVLTGCSSGRRAANERGDHAADPRAETDGDVGDLDRGHGAQQLKAVGGDAGDQQRMERGHHVQRAAACQGLRVLARRLEVLTVLDELDSQGAHRRVLRCAVAMRYDDGGRQPIAARGKADRLPVVAARRADNAAHRARRAAEVVEVHQPAAQLEGADRSVVLVLHPHLRAEPLAK
jgi:hypothetical protein